MSPENLITNEIVETSLKNDKGKAVHLTSWTRESCTKGGENFFNVVKRIKVHYSKEGKECNTSYVAKVNPCKINDSFNPYRQRAMIKEIFFYKDLLPLLNLELEKMGELKLSVPKYLHSSVVTEKEVIVFEDLSLLGFETFPRGGVMDEPHTVVMVKEIARFHAACFALQRTLETQNIEEIYPLLVESWIVGDPQLRNAFDDVMKKGVKHNLNLIKVLEEFKDFIPWLQGIMGKEMETLCNELKPRSTWTGIVHGDYHKTNVLFRYNESRIPQEIMIIDWQTIRVANPASELDYLMYSSYFGTLREELFPLVIKTFYETFHKITGSETLFTQESLESEVRNNNFGLLLCFFLVPMSLCVSEPSELFLVETNAMKKRLAEDEVRRNARELMKTKPNLASVMQDYIEAIRGSTLMQ